MEVLKESIAYKSGWQDGRFGRPGISAQEAARSRRLDYISEIDRIAYRYGHREGRRIRSLLCEEAEMSPVVPVHG